MTVGVRAARPGDGDAIARVWLSAAAYYADLDPAHFQVPSGQGLAGLFDKAITDAGADVLQLVAELNGRVAGWLSARVNHPDQDAAVELAREHGWTRLIVEVLIVDGGQWRLGIGTVLLDRAESWGRDKGARVARLGTYARSLVAVPVYEEHAGYSRRAIIFQKSCGVRIRRSMQGVRPVRPSPGPQVRLHRVSGTVVLARLCPLSL